MSVILIPEAEGLGLYLATGDYFKVLVRQTQPLGRSHLGRLHVTMLGESTQTECK